MSDDAFFKSKSVKALLIVFLVILITILTLTLTPWGRGTVNRWTVKMETTDINTQFETRADYEKQLRSLYTTATVDATYYREYKDSEKKSESDLATAAFQRLVSTIAQYNEIYSKLSYLGDDMKPADLPDSLDLNKLLEVE